MSFPTTTSPAKTPTVRRRSTSAQNDRIDSVLLRLESVRSQKGFGTFVLGVCGCNRRSGVSTVAANLAVRAAEMSLGRVLLVDANLMNPKQASNFRLGNCDGLADVLSGSAGIESALHNGVVDGLNVMGAGTRKCVKSVSVTPDSIHGLINEVRTAFDFVIFDLPSDADSARTMMISGHVDGAIMVVDAQKTRAREARAMLESLRENKVEVLGTVLNRTKRTLPAWLDRLL